ARYRVRRCLALRSHLPRRPPRPRRSPSTPLFRSSRCGRPAPVDPPATTPGASAPARPCRGRARAGRQAAPDAPAPRSAERCSPRSEEHTSELQSRFELVCRLLLEKKKGGGREGSGRGPGGAAGTGEGASGAAGEDRRAVTGREVGEWRWGSYGAEDGGDRGASASA